MARSGLPGHLDDEDDQRLRLEVGTTNRLGQAPDLLHQGWAHDRRDPRDQARHDAHTVKAKGQVLG